MKSDPHAFATLAAEQKIKELGITSLPIDPIAIARAKRIEVVAKPASPGVSGMLNRVGNEFVIAYATHIDSEGFRHFCVAHELGHYFLPGHPEALIEGTEGVHESRAGYASSDRYEMESDRFAAGFLMPRQLFFPALEQAGKGGSAIESLAALCKTSLHATAIRYTQCTREPVAIVLSIGSQIDHCFMSEALKNVSSIDWLRKRETVPRGAPTFVFNQDPENVRRAVRVEDGSNLQQWFGGPRSVDISEDVIGLGSYGKTLTVLYDIDLPEPEDEEDEAALQESWTARFRS